MFIPLHDGLPLRRLRAPYVTYGLIGANVGLFVMSAVLTGAGMDEGVLAFGLGTVPGVLFGYEYLPEGYPFVPTPFTVITSLFLHITWWHLLGNMLFLWVFGDNVEDELGHLRYLVFYLACGAAASFVHALTDPDSVRPLIGASGAVSGVVAAYLVLHPRVWLWGLFLKGIPLRLPAIWALGFWIGMQVVAALFGGDDSVGWWAHLGGLGTGFLLIRFMRRSIGAGAS
jgi:membrane associated rhomboid family serine protease